MIIDQKLFFFFYNTAHRFVFLDKLVIFIADIFPYIVILLAGLFLLFHHDVIKSTNPFKELFQKWKEISLAFLSGIFAWFLASFLKYVIHSPRPFRQYEGVVTLFNETGYGFPSGHATFFMALAVSIFLVHKKAGKYFILFALLIGIARIIAGVHSPLDILGGFILGTLIAYIIKKFI